MADKRATVADMVAEIESGMTVGIGGWGSRRKPMAVVRALLHSDVRDLTIVTYGGPDVGLLVHAGKASRVIAPFVTLDSIALDPLWRSARQAGSIALTEIDEGLFYLGLQAAAWRIPFIPARGGLGSVVLEGHAEITTVLNPYVDGPWADPADGSGPFVAMPALRLDVALVHVNVADTAGNAMVLAPDPFFDDLFLGAATRRLVTADKVVEAGTLAEHGPLVQATIHRMLTDRIAEAPGGAHFTANPPDYGRDEAFQKAYVAAAKDPDLWAAFADRFLSGSEEDYHRAVSAWREEQ